MERRRHGRIVVCDGFASASACARISAAMARGVATPSEIAVGGMYVDASVRHSLDVEVDDAAQRDLVELLAPASAIAQEETGLSGLTFEGPGCLLYPPGAFYRRHRDVMATADGSAWPRRVSLVLFLTGDDALPIEGGELRLHHAPGEWLDIAPERGRLVLFPADMVHEVLPVRAGVRQTVVDWLA